MKKCPEPAVARNSPLEKGGSAEGAGLSHEAKAPRRMVAPFEIACIEVTLSPIRKTTPGRPRRRL